MFAANPQSPQVVYLAKEVGDFFSPLTKVSGKFKTTKFGHMVFFREMQTHKLNQPMKLFYQTESDVNICAVLCDASGLRVHFIR